MGKSPKLSRNSVVTLEIEKLAYGGAGLARVDGYVVFVKHAVPGDVVRVRVVKSKQSHAEAVVEELERPSPDRVEPPCELFGTCGGCVWQQYDYARQIEWKRLQIDEAIAHIAKNHDSYELAPIIASPELFHYRNKMEFSFGLDDAGQVVLGFHYPGRWDRILEVRKCWLHPAPFDELLRILQDWAREYKLTTYDQRTHEGFLRFAIVRHSATTGRIMLILITHEGDLPDREGLARRIQQAVPEVCGIMWGVSTRMADIAYVGEERWRWGTPELTETVNGLTFKLAPQSFFQVNTAGAELLYARTVEMAGFEPGDRVLDAYCGTGTIALHCARRLAELDGDGRVIGVELIREAIWNARENARANGIRNATFIAAPMREGLQLARRAAGRAFTHVIIDPPRGGMDKRSMNGLVQLGAPTFIYVSCNPATLGRDLVTLSEAGYRVEQVQPIDLFPHTYHVETIVRLRRVAEG